MTAAERSGPARLSGLAALALLQAAIAWIAPCLAAEVLSADYREVAPGQEMSLPRALPVPAVPVANPFSPAKAELGRHLFYERGLSGNGSYSCASCHQQHLAFTDGRARAVGATGEVHRRGAMTLTNVAYNRTFNWAGSRTGSLEEQMLVPMFGILPVEMGMTGAGNDVLERLATSLEYRRMFASAFPDDPVPLSLENVVRAIATFERTLISAGSPFDRYVRDGDRTALSAEAERGMRLFFSPRLACSECHAGFNLAGNTGWYGIDPAPPAFHDNGLHRPVAGADSSIDTGHFEETGEPRDVGAFRAPTLRNIELTAPYMHDGSLATLEEVVAHYSAGGRARLNGPSPFQSDLVRPLGLTATEASDLVAFLESLTDHDFVTDPRFADPHASDSLVGDLGGRYSHRANTPFFPPAFPLPGASIHEISH